MLSFLTDVLLELFASCVDAAVASVAAVAAAAAALLYWGSSLAGEYSAVYCPFGLHTQKISELSSI